MTALLQCKTMDLLASRCKGEPSSLQQAIRDWWGHELKVLRHLPHCLEVRREAILRTKLRASCRVSCARQPSTVQEPCKNCCRAPRLNRGHGAAFFWSPSSLLLLGVAAPSGMLMPLKSSLARNTGFKQTLGQATPEMRDNGQAGEWHLAIISWHVGPSQQPL